MSKAVNFVRTNSDIILAVIIGAYLRANIILRDEMWFDEAYVGIITRLSKSSFVRELLVDAHPPLYNVINKAWSLFFGTSEISLRFMPLIFGIATILVAYKLAEKMGNKQTAAMAAFLVAINPFLVGYSIEARSYSLYGLVTLVTAYFLISKKYRLFLAGTVAMIQTHYMSSAFLIMLFPYFFFTLHKEKKLGRFLPASALALSIIALTLVVAALVQGSNLNLHWIRESSFLNIPRSFIAYTYGVQVKATGSDAINRVKLFALNEFSLGGIFFALFIIGASYTLYKFKRNSGKIEQLIFLLALILIPQLFLILLGYFTKYSIYVERYLTPAAIFFSISVAFILTSIEKFEITGLIILFYAITLLRIQPPDYVKGMKHLASTYQGAGREMVFISPIDYVVARYYFGETNENLRLQNLKNPKETFWHWPLIKKNIIPQKLKNALIVSTDESKIPSGYRKISEVGSYKIYTASYN